MNNNISHWIAAQISDFVSENEMVIQTDYEATTI